jgi:hypothetical protein
MRRSLSAYAPCEAKRGKAHQSAPSSFATGPRGGIAGGATPSPENSSPDAAPECPGNSGGRLCTGAKGGHYCVTETGAKQYHRAQ